MGCIEKLNISFWDVSVAQLVVLMSGVMLGSVVEVVGSNLARGKIFTASIGSVDLVYPSAYIYIVGVVTEIQSESRLRLHCALFPLAASIYATSRFIYFKLKQCFQRKTMSSNHKLSWQACLLLFIVSQRYRLKSINSFKGEYAQTQFWSNFEITKCCGYLEYIMVKVIKISGRVLASRLKGRGFEPPRRHCVVSLSKTH